MVSILPVTSGLLLIGGFYTILFSTTAGVVTGSSDYCTTDTFHSPCNISTPHDGFCSCEENESATEAECCCKPVAEICSSDINPDVFEEEPTPVPFLTPDGNVHECSSEASCTSHNSNYTIACFQPQLEGVFYSGICCMQLNNPPPS